MTRLIAVLLFWLPLTATAGPTSPAGPTGPGSPGSPTSPKGAAGPTSPVSPKGPASPARPASPTGPEGNWFGTLDAGPIQLRLAFHVTRRPDGTLDATLESVDQGGKIVAFETTTFVAPTLTLDLAKRGIRYQATLDGDTLTGTFTQGKSLPLAMKRMAPPEAKRPQLPRPPFPYRELPVTLAVPTAYEPRRATASVSLTGTLTLPPGKGPFPAVLFITGSGPEDRDETIFGHKPFLVIADALTRAGIATLRFDDRGTGSSGGTLEGLTTLDLARDATAELELLARRPEISARAIGLLGHSEGGVIAPIVAARSALPKFLVLLAGTGMPGLQVMHQQAAAVLRATGATSDAIAHALRTTDKLLALAVVEPDRAKLEAKVRAAFADDPTELDTALVALRGITVWMRAFLTLDPTVYFKQVKVPVLALNGERDVQVDAGNLPLIEQALRAGGNRDITTVRLPELNHLFQHARTGAPSEYATIEETVAPEVLAKICGWVVAHARP